MSRVHVTPGALVRFIAAIVSLTAIVTAVAAFNESDAIKNGLIKACETSRGPLTAYFEGEIEETDEESAYEIAAIRDEIAETRTTDFSVLFPGVPEDRIRELLDEAITENRAEIKDLERRAADRIERLGTNLTVFDPARCEGQYE